MMNEGTNNNGKGQDAMKYLFGQSVAEFMTSRYNKVREGLTAARERDNALCNEQIALRQKQYRAAHCCKSIYGWTLRNRSGLDNFEIIARARDGDGSACACFNAAKFWFDIDPEHRCVDAPDEFFADLNAEIDAVKTAPYA